MATLQALEVLNRLDDDSDWNESDEEGESGSEDDYDEDGDEMDYLAVAQVLYRSFLILIRALRCFLKYYSGVHYFPERTGPDRTKFSHYFTERTGHWRTNECICAHAASVLSRVYGGVTS